MNEQERVESPPAGRAALWPAAAALLWLAAACSGDPLCPPGTLPGLCGLEGRCLECNTAADCGSDQGCALDGECYDAGSGHGAICTSDADCPEGQLCREGLCLVRCSSRADCRDNQGCREGVCISRRCSAAGSCPQGWEPVPDSLACRPLAAGEHADPWTVMPSAELAHRRGWRVGRGIVHSHSPYSHDACDDQPFIDGQRNEQCFAEVRAGLCQTAQDFVFLTDHADSFADHEYPDVLLYAAGDSLIERGGRPVANRLVCPDGRRVIVAAGTETGLMPIGLEHHLGDSPAERHAWYQRSDAEALRALQAAGALVFLQHTEGWSIEQIQQLPIDGIECYNLHQNLMDNMGAALEMALLLDQDPAGMPAVELALITVFQENSRDLERWAIGSLDAPLPAVLATDAHRNVFSEPSPDGERLDSFRRMMHWFSNYVLVPAAGRPRHLPRRGAPGAPPPAPLAGRQTGLRHPGQADPRAALDLRQPHHRGRVANISPWDPDAARVSGGVAEQGGGVDDLFAGLAVWAALGDGGPQQQAAVEGLDQLAGGAGAGHDQVEGVRLRGAGAGAGRVEGQAQQHQGGQNHEGRSFHHHWQRTPPITTGSPSMTV